MILSPLQGRRAILQHLQAELPNTLPAVTAAVGVPMTPPALWVPLTTFFAVPEEKLPCVYVVADAFTAVRDSYDGETAADLPARVVVVVAGRSRDEAQDRATAYADAIRYALRADVTCGGALDDMRWQAQSPSGTDEADGHYRASADVTVTYRATVPTDLPAVAAYAQTPTLTLERLEL